MLKMLTRKIDAATRTLTSYSIFTNYLGLARSILALGTMLTLVLNRSSVLFAPIAVEDQSFDFILIRKFSFFKLFPFSMIHIPTWCAVIILMVVISGWRPRITCFLHAYISVSFINAAITIEGGDQITSNLTLLLIPICLCDPRSNHWQPLNEATEGNPYRQDANLVANFFYLLIRLQIALVYFHSAIGKFPVEEWKNGTAIYYWFHHPIFGMPHYVQPILDPVIRNPYAIVLITWGVLVFEILLFLGLVIDKRYRKVLLIAGLIFHFLIAAIHGLFSFFIAMSGALILYLGAIQHNIFKAGWSWHAVKSFLHKKQDASDA